MWRLPKGRGLFLAYTVVELALLATVILAMGANFDEWFLVGYWLSFPCWLVVLAIYLACHPSTGSIWWALVYGNLAAAILIVSLLASIWPLPASGNGRFSMWWTEVVVGQFTRIALYGMLPLAAGIIAVYQTARLTVALAAQRSAKKRDNRDR